MPRLTSILAPVAAALLLACAPAKVLCPREYQVDFAEAAALAAKAALAYGPDSAVAAACGQDSCFVVSGRATGTRAFLQRDDSARTQLIAFRGTHTLGDIRVDAEYAQSRDTALRMSLHRGFSRAADDLLGELEPRLRPGYRTVLTGHSLGGALAAVTALRLAARGHDVKAVTFGQPKVTNAAGARRAGEGKVALTRFIHGKDVVALVPPVDWRPGADAGSYAHFGREVALDGQGFECLEEHWSRRHDPAAWWERAEAAAVEDHAMALYAARLSELAGRQAGGPPAPAPSR